MVTDLPPCGAYDACFAPGVGLLRPCVVSHSRRRRLRDRRIAVRRSQQQSLTLRGALTDGLYSFSRSPSIKLEADELEHWPTETVLNRDAVPFMPTDVFAFSAVGDETEEVLTYLQASGTEADEPEVGHALAKLLDGTLDTCIAKRRILRESCVAECLPEPRLVPTKVAINVTYIPARKELEDTCLAEGLPVTLPTAEVIKHCSVYQDEEKYEFSIGDILQFADGKRTHILNYVGRGSSSKYCHDEYVRVLKVGRPPDHEGWLEVRALSWESPDRDSDFECRGWLQLLVDDVCILKKPSQIDVLEGSA